MRFIVLFTVLLIVKVACQSPTPQTPSKENEQSAIVEPPSAPAPPAPIPDYDTSQWADLHFLDTTILLDLKYATTDNFVNEQLYECPRCFLRPTAARALVALQRHFQQKGLGIKVYDCYRPRPIQQKLWDKVPNASYVTPPSKGSMHNRGLAVDLSLVDRNGVDLEMGTPYDFFGPKAHHTYTNLPDTILQNRILLKTTLRDFGFQSIRTEWWHYSFRSDPHPLSDMLWNCDSELH
ncbi:MAG: M15 family metallopeptidase [Bacteroidota bacterium]